MLLPSLSCEDYLHIITCSLALCIKAPSSGLEAMRPWINLGSGSPTSGRYTGAHGFTGHGQCFASSSGGTAWSCTALVARYARHNGHLTGTSSCFSDEHNPRNVFGVIVSWLCSKPGTTTNSVGVSGEARASGVASLTGFGGDEGFCGVWEIEVQRLAETAGDCATGKTACGSAYCDSGKAVSVSRAAQCNIRSSVLNQVVARYVLASLLSSLICRSHFMTDSDGFPQCPGMFVFQAVLQPTWHEWFRWSPTCLGMSWHVCFSICTAGDRTWVMQVDSNMSWHVCLQRYSGMFWNVWWFIQVIISVRRQVTFGSEAADRLATSQTKKNAMACLQGEWLVSTWSSPWRYDRRYVRRFSSNKTYKCHGGGHSK